MVKSTNDNPSNTTNRPYCFIPGNGKGAWVRVMLDDILYIQADSNYMQVVTLAGTRLTYFTMEQMSGILPPDRFIRVHRSYIVNLCRVESLDTHTVYLEGGKEVPISRSHRANLLTRICGR